MVFLHVQAASLIPECVCVRVHSMWCVFSPSTKVFFFYCSISTSWISIWFTHTENTCVCVCVCVFRCCVFEQPPCPQWWCPPVIFSAFDRSETGLRQSHHSLFTTFTAPMTNPACFVNQQLWCRWFSVNQTLSNITNQIKIEQNTWIPICGVQQLKETKKNDLYFILVSCWRRIWTSF